MPLHSSFPHPQDVILTSGSDVVGTVTNPLFVTGSLSTTPPAVQNVTGSAWTPTITGSVRIENQVDVTGSSWTPTITGSVRVENRVDVSGSAWTPTITGSVRVENRVDVRELSTSASVSFVSSSQVQSITFASANLARSGIIVYNDSNKILYLKLGVSASINDYTTQMASDDYYEVPFGYTGRIDGISASGGAPLEGPIRVTELV